MPDLRISTPFDEFETEMRGLMEGELTPDDCELDFTLDVWGAIQNAYDEGHVVGKEAGRTEGYAEGYEAGFTEGKKHSTQQLSLF